MRKLEDLKETSSKTKAYNVVPLRGSNRPTNWVRHIHRSQSFSDTKKPQSED